MLSEMLPTEITENSGRNLASRYCSAELRANVPSLTHTHAHTHTNHVFYSLFQESRERIIGKCGEMTVCSLLGKDFFWSVGANPEGAQLSNAR